jgi:hypothetical protein
MGVRHCLTQEYCGLRDEACFPLMVFSDYNDFGFFSNGCTIIAKAWIIGIPPSEEEQYDNSLNRKPSLFGGFYPTSRSTGRITCSRICIISSFQCYRSPTQKTTV